MNFAGVFKLPVIFFCQNNQYAISVPFSRQTATETIAEKAAAYGVPGVRVDGSNATEIYRAVHSAVLRAASGLGPTLIEALTYRYGAHTTSDDPGKYRPTDEALMWRKRDPIERIKRELMAFGLWSEKQNARWMEKVDEALNDAIQKVESLPPPNLDDMFEHVYEQMPRTLIRQTEDLHASLSFRGLEDKQNG